MDALIHQQLFNSIKAAPSSGKQREHPWCELDAFCVTMAACELCSLPVRAAAAGKLDAVRNGAQPRCRHLRELGQVPPPQGWELLLAPTTSTQSSSYTGNEKHLMALVILLDQAFEMHFLNLHHTTCILCLPPPLYFFYKRQLHAEVSSKITLLRLFLMSQEWSELGFPVHGLWVGLCGHQLRCMQFYFCWETPASDGTESGSVLWLSLGWVHGRAGHSR